MRFVSLKAAIKPSHEAPGEIIQEMKGLDRRDNDNRLLLKRAGSFLIRISWYHTDVLFFKTDQRKGSESLIRCYFDWDGRACSNLGQKWKEKWKRTQGGEIRAEFHPPTWSWQL